MAFDTPSRFPRRPALALLLTMPMLTGCIISIGGCSWMEPKVWVEETESRQLGPEGAARVRCETRNGSVRVTAHQDPVVEVVARKLAGGADHQDAAECLEAIEVFQEFDGDTLVLGWRWAEEQHHTWGAEISFEVKQPADLALDVVTRNGAITCRGVRAGVELNSRNGAVTVADCAGPTRISTRNGAVSAAVDSDDVDIETRNGAISLRLTTDGEVDGTVRSRNGAVAVAFEGSPSAAVHCSSRSGEVHSRQQMSNLMLADNSLSGTLGQGGGKFGVATRNGAISIR